MLSNVRATGTMTNMYANPVTRGGSVWCIDQDGGENLDLRRPCLAAAHVTAGGSVLASEGIQQLSFTHRTQTQLNRSR